MLTLVWSKLAKQSGELVSSYSGQFGTTTSDIALAIEG